MAAVRRGFWFVVAAAVGALWVAAFWLSFQLTRQFRPGDVAAAERKVEQKRDAPAEEEPAAEETTPVSPLASLVGQIVPERGPARPPFLPARYDLGLKPSDAKERGGLDELRERALERQRGLQKRWKKLKAQPPAEMPPEGEAAWKLLAYAFAEGELDEALAAARRAGPAAR